MFLDFLSSHFLCKFGFFCEDGQGYKKICFISVLLYFSIFYSTVGLEMTMHQNEEVWRILDLHFLGLSGLVSYDGEISSAESIGQMFFRQCSML